MASYGQQIPPKHGARHAPHGAYSPQAVPVQSGPPAPAGTFQSGTKIQVGSHRVVIQKYLSEGGFAHVYLVKLPKPVDGTDQAVLKRVAVPDKEALRGMRTEVETMKRLKGHRMIVTYIDSHASEMKGGGYEVFLLMEYCGGGGLIDFMNTRLQHRLTEPEILNIFCDIAEGVACMHYLKPALLHRDLKIENVLITNRGSSKRFKLCDFGSSAPPRPAPTSVVECRLMDEDVQKHTTLQYRSPEMVDVYRKQPLNEKSDIWALGVFLYKLCYYTTPFEDQGQLAILNASYRFPSQPPFSDRLKRLIASMLQENLNQRPNIYQVVKEACSMEGRQVPIQDIYSGQAKTASRPSEKAPSKGQAAPSSGVGAVWSPPVEEKQKIPEVTPMRRGRPTASPAPGAAQTKPPSQPSKGDPFAALDSKPKAGGDPDEFSSRFPSLDQFSLLHDSGSKFDFDSASAPAPPPKKDDAKQRAPEHLVDEVFAANRSPPTGGIGERPSSVAPAIASRVVSQHVEKISRNSSGPAKQDVSRAQSIISSNPDLQAISTQTTPKYVSTGTSTSDLPSLAAQSGLKPSYRVSAIQTSESPRSTSLSRPSSTGPQRTESPEVMASVSARISSIQSEKARAPSASGASIEVTQPPEDLMDFPSRSSTLNVEAPAQRQRPASTNFEATTTMDFLREREISRPQSRVSGKNSPHVPSPSLIPTDDDHQPSPQPEADNLEFLRSMESGDASKDKSTKRSSLGSLSGGKGMLASKFGDAFKRFEGGQQPGARTPSPLKEDDRPDLTPIAGSVATDGGSDNGQPPQDLDALTPEMRREIEQRQLEEEEQRVKAAQEAYRNRVATGGAGHAGSRNTTAPARASTIQNRVQNLLDEQKVSHVKKTASGYGKYSDDASAASKLEKPLPEVPRKPLAASKPPTKPIYGGAGSNAGTASAPPTLAANKPKPAAPKKPVHLNSLPTGQRSPAKSTQPAPNEQLIAVDLPGQPVLDMSAHEKDAYLEEFSQRFPSLSAMETGGRSSGR